MSTPSDDKQPRDAAYWAQTSTLKVGRVPTGALNLNVEGRQLLGPLQQGMEGKLPKILAKVEPLLCTSGGHCAWGGSAHQHVDPWRPSSRPPAFYRGNGDLLR